MISRGKNGRRRSNTTGEEVGSLSSRAVANLTEEEMSLLSALTQEGHLNKFDIEDDVRNHTYHTIPVSMAEFLLNPYYLGESCTTLYPELMEDLVSLFGYPYREAVLTGGIGVGKCVGGETEIYDPVSGQRMTAKEMASIGEGIGCASYDKNLGVMRAAECTAKFSGIKLTGDLSLKTGRTLRLSLDHPVLTPYGWKCASEIKKGDMIASSRRMPPPISPLKIIDDELIWVAYMLADGGMTGECMTFTNKTDAVLEEYKSVTGRLGKTNRYSKRTGTSFIRMDGKATTVRPSGVQWIRNKYGLRKRSVDKRIPSVFYGLNDRQLGLFLNRIWACDGWICRRGGANSKQWEVGISLGSEEFARDIQQLLLRFGIVARIRHRKMGYTHNGEKRVSDAWSLSILGRNDIIKFLTSVGLIKGKEDRCHMAINNLSVASENSNVDITPDDRVVFSRIRKEIGPISKRAYWPRPAQGSMLGNSVFKIFAANYKLPEWCRWWGDVYWDVAEEFAVSGIHEPVYDLSVPGTENFAPLGVIVHNTHVLSITISRIIYELSCMYSPQKVFGLSSSTEMVLPLISKNLTLAREIMKPAVDEKIKESPYFMTKFTPDFKKDYTLFPHGIRMTIGSYGSDRVLGSNVFSAALDECPTRKTIVTVEYNGIVCEKTVGNLMAMSKLGYSDCKIVCLDHDSGTLKSGWWRIKESTIQPIVKIETDFSVANLSTEHPVLVKSGEWMFYKHAKDIAIGDIVAMEVTYASKRSTFERGIVEEASGGNELEFAGVRRERIKVSDLPPELFLTKIIRVTNEEPEQTYSICTEFNTFIADGIVVHNTNFPPKRKAQQISTGFGQKLKTAHFDIVEKMYLGLVRRIKSRFQNAGGGFPGMVILASSAATVESFTERKIRDGKFDPEIFVRDHTQWTAKPKEEFCGEVFWVLCSTSAMKSRILTEDEYDMVTDEWMEANDAFVMDIPIEFKADFESNMEEALRDIAGFSTEAISQFIQRPKAILEGIEPERIHPFSDEEWIAGAPGKFLWNHLSIKFQRRLPGGFKEDAFKPRRNPRAMRWCHLDTSTSGDSSGMAVGHIDRWVEVVQTDSEGNKQVDVLPYYIIDFMLRINPPPGEQIYMPNLRTMIYQFMGKGYQFAGVSTDTYQYVEMHQQIRRRGISTHIISMDTSTEPYDELKSAFYDNRIEIYNYKPFIDEFKFLEYDRLSGKIDHPVAGSKDVADAVAGVIHGLKTFSSRMPVHGDKQGSGITPHEFSWVTPMIPADQVDIEAVKEAKKNDFEDHFMPIIFYGD